MKKPTDTGAVKPSARRTRADRPLHVPTAETRRQVEMMAAFGNTEGQIARIVGVSEPTLRLHYRCELDNGHVRANNMVAMNHFKQATNDDPKSVQAAQFWLKTRAGWREPPSEQKHSGAIGTFDLTKVRDDDLAKIEAILAPFAGTGGAAATDPGGEGKA